MYAIYFRAKALIASPSPVVSGEMAAPEDPPTVPRVDAASIDAATFRRRFMEANLPVIITNFTRNWRACSEWVAGGQPALDRVAALFGSSCVPVDERCGRRRDMSLAEYAEWWRARDGETDSECVDS